MDVTMRHRFYHALLLMITCACLAFAAPAAAQDYTTGLVAHWTFDDGTGTTATDSASTNDGTLTNMDAATDWVDGRIGSDALDFDGTDDYVNIGNGSTMEVSLPFTISVWVYLNSPVTNPDTILNVNAFSVPTNYYGYNIYLHDIGNGINFFSSLYNGGPASASGRYTTGTSSALSVGQWYHLTAVLRGFSKANEYYINGVKQRTDEESGLGSTLVYSDHEGVIGRNLLNGRTLDGQIDDVRIYNRALSATDVKHLYYGTGYGICSNPTGFAGEIIYNDAERVPQFCNGAEWKAFPKRTGSMTVSTTCSSPAGTEGDLIYNGDQNVMQWCGGGVWHPMGPVPGAGGTGCTGPSRGRGSLEYFSNYGQLVYCDGTDWVAVTSPGCEAPNPLPGTVCADGTVYAGLSPDGNVKMFTTRCDEGQTWDGTSCTGTPARLHWNNGNTTGYVTTGATSTVDGETNTTTIIGFDSDNVTTGNQPHLAAERCANLTANGYADWYLPAFEELRVLYRNQDIIGNFRPGGVSNYWASTENANNRGSRTRFVDGGSSGFDIKELDHHVRCVRK
jgi:hypothetical protein